MGKYLYQLFVQMTYCTIVEKLNIKYILMQIHSAKTVSVCHCYVGASFECGLRFFWIILWIKMWSYGKKY